MIVDLEDKTETGWFDLRAGGRVQLRLLSITDVRAIRDASVKTVVEYPLLDGVYKRFESEKFNAELATEIRHDRTIMGWEKLFDKNEKEIPVTRANKKLLMELVPEFREAVDNGLKALKEADEAKSGQAEKNSLMS
ncbi:MAG: hypothetical protein ABIJ57_07195 [Pseudomonadota bacterium]